MRAGYVLYRALVFVVVDATYPDPVVEQSWPWKIKWNGNWKLGEMEWDRNETLPWLCNNFRINFQTISCTQLHRQIHHSICIPMILLTTLLGQCLVVLPFPWQHCHNYISITSPLTPPSVPPPLPSLPLLIGIHRKNMIPLEITIKLNLVSHMWDHSRTSNMHVHVSCLLYPLHAYM